MCYLCEKGHVVMERLKIAFFSFLLFQEASTIPTRSTVNLLRYNDYYDTIYDDYDVAPDTKNLYGIVTRYQQDDIPPICNETIVLPPLTLRTLQNQIIPYWFKYMVALHDSRFHTFSSRPAKHSICCAWDFYECSLKHKNAGQSNDIKEEINTIEVERSLNPYAANNGGSQCCKDRYKNCKSIVANFTKELEFIEEEVLEEHLEEQFQCSELDEGSEHQLEIAEDRVVKIKVAFRLFTKNNLNTYELIQFDGTTLFLAEDTLFDSGRSKTLFEVHDWGGWCHDSVTSRSFNRAYAAAGHDYQVIAVRWIPVGGYQNLAQGHRQLGGNVVGKFIRELVNQHDLDMNAVHFVATGAGVPFVYYVGKAIQNEGIDIPGRITAIDAGPGFEYPEWTNEFKDLANFTEAIHTSISYSGDNRQGRYPKYQEEPFAHVDFYPNGGYDQLCFEEVCPKRRSHIHGIYYFNESIIAQNKPMESRFMSWRCGSSDDWSLFQQGAGIWKCGFDKSFLSDSNENRFVPMGEYVMERGRPLDGVYFLRTNGQRPWSYASYDTCDPSCSNGMVCDDGICLCGPHNGEVCGGTTPSCLTSNNDIEASDLTSRCRPCTNEIKRLNIYPYQGGQGSCPNSGEICINDGRCLTEEQAICENFNCNNGQCIVSENGDATCICDSGYFGSNCDQVQNCNDGIQNGDEEGVDCGESAGCDPCPSCFDGIQNGDEEGVDCGGTGGCSICDLDPLYNDLPNDSPDVYDYEDGEANVVDEQESMYDPSLGTKAVAQSHPNSFKWSTWEEWTSCSKSCGPGGMKTRTRSCLNTKDDTDGPKNSNYCKEDGQEANKEETACNEEIRCSRGIDGGYSEWIPAPPLYSPCTAKCKGDQGTMSRFRRCNNPEPMLGGKSCKEQRELGLLGSHTETIACEGTIPYQTEDPLRECFRFPSNI